MLISDVLIPNTIVSLPATYVYRDSVYGRASDPAHTPRNFGN